jgi:hypothetical protein
MLQMIDIQTQPRYSISLLVYRNCIHNILKVDTNTRNGFHIWYSDTLTSNAMKNLRYVSLRKIF